MFLPCKPAVANNPIRAINHGGVTVDVDGKMPPSEIMILKFQPLPRSVSELWLLTDENAVAASQVRVWMIGHLEHVAILHVATVHVVAVWSCLEEPIPGLASYASSIIALMNEKGVSKWVWRGWQVVWLHTPSSGRPGSSHPLN